jgi:hypothetical protein
MAGLKQWALFGGGGVISQAEMDAYLKANSYRVGTVAEQME